MTESLFRNRAEQLREQYPDRTGERLAREAAEKQARVRARQVQSRQRAEVAARSQKEAETEQERKIARELLLTHCISMGADLAATLSEMGISPVLKAKVKVQVEDSAPTPAGLPTRLLNAFRPNKHFYKPEVYEEDYGVVGYWRLTESDSFWLPAREASYGGQKAPHPHWDGGGPYVAPTEAAESKFRPSGGMEDHGIGLLQSSELVNYSQQKRIKANASVSQIHASPVASLEQFEELCVNLLEKEIVRTNQR